MTFPISFIREKPPFCPVRPDRGNPPSTHDLRNIQNRIRPYPSLSSGRYVDVAGASPALIYALRRETIGYVSQFLRVVPRVSALDTVIEPLLARGVPPKQATDAGRILLERLHIPSTMWHLSATTFSGGEQQRINLARGFIAPYPILLLDEPTASLDLKNRKTVIQLITEALRNNTCVIGVFHDPADHRSFGDQVIDLSSQHRQETLPS